MGDRSLLCEACEWWCSKREVGREGKLCAPGLEWTGVKAWRSPPGSHPLVRVGLSSCGRANPEPNSDQAGGMNPSLNPPSLGVPSTVCPLSGTALRPPELTQACGVGRPTSSPNCILIKMVMIRIACYSHSLKDSASSPDCQAVGHVCLLWTHCANLPFCMQNH